MACDPTSTGATADMDISSTTTRALPTAEVTASSATESETGNLDDQGHLSPTGSVSQQEACEINEPCMTRGTTSPSSTRSSKRVRFGDPLVTAVWEAVADYDRRSIVVDLSRTPFALFRKDALLMAKPPAMAATSFPTKAVPAELSIPPKSDIAVYEKAAKPRDCEMLPATAAARVLGRGVESLPDQRSNRRHAAELSSWDSEESDSSAVTDTETDADHSDTDSNPGSETSNVKPAFFGVWKRTHTEGYDTLLRTQGVPERRVAQVARKHPIHIIDHDDQYFRVIINNGLSKMDNTFFIGDEPRQDKINGRMIETSLNWVDLSGNGQMDELAMSSVTMETGEEVLAIRSLREGGDEMVLTHILRRPSENFEVRARHMYKRVTDRSELRSTRPAHSPVTVTRRSPRLYHTKAKS